MLRLRGSSMCMDLQDLGKLEYIPQLLASTSLAYQPFWRLIYRDHQLFGADIGRSRMVKVFCRAEREPVFYIVKMTAPQGQMLTGTLCCSAVQLSVKSCAFIWASLSLVHSYGMDDEDSTSWVRRELSLLCKGEQVEVMYFGWLDKPSDQFASGV